MYYVHFSAIKIYEKNIKAYYRQALAHKNLKNYQEAYRAACEGYEMQPSSVCSYFTFYFAGLLQFLNVVY